MRTDFLRITEKASHRAGQRAHICWQPEQSFPLGFGLNLQAVKRCSITTSQFSGAIKCGRKELPTIFLPGWSQGSLLICSCVIQSNKHTHFKVQFGGSSWMESLQTPLSSGHGMFQAQCLGHGGYLTIAVPKSQASIIVGFPPVISMLASWKWLLGKQCDIMENMLVQFCQCWPWKYNLTSMTFNFPTWSPRILPAQSYHVLPFYLRGALWRLTCLQRSLRSWIVEIPTTSKETIDIDFSMRAEKFLIVR